VTDASDKRGKVFAVLTDHLDGSLELVVAGQLGVGENGVEGGKSLQQGISDEVVLAGSEIEELEQTAEGVGVGSTEKLNRVATFKSTDRM